MHHLCASPFRAFRFFLAPYVQEDPVLRWITISDNLSLIESGRTSQAESRRAYVSRAASGKCLSYEKARVTTTKGMEVGYNCLPCLHPLFSPPSTLLFSCGNGRSRIRRKTEFPIRLVSAFPIYLPCRGSFSSRCIAAARNAQLLEVTV